MVDCDLTDCGDFSLLPQQLSELAEKCKFK